MRKLFLLFLCCIVICGCGYRYGKTELGDAKNEIVNQYCEGIAMLFMPQISLYHTETNKLVYQDMEKLIVPVFSCAKKTKRYTLAMQEQKQQLELDNTDESVGQEVETELVQGQNNEERNQQTEET